MTNYNLLISPEFKYLSYLSNEVERLKEIIDKSLTDRDTKLNLILDENYSRVIEEIDRVMNSLIHDINKIDIYNINRDELEITYDKVTKFAKYCEYALEKLISMSVVDDLDV